ncbi:hypothetical protein BX600DRAFT_165496 [Xylariales sp. PMI_506]|nr:hypothetical protein BX600DRAFT_165496 [Xylariales sp. PMI_506]
MHFSCAAWMGIPYLVGYTWPRICFGCKMRSSRAYIRTMYTSISSAGTDNHAHWPIAVARLPGKAEAPRSGLLHFPSPMGIGTREFPGRPPPSHQPAFRTFLVLRTL